MKKILEVLCVWLIITCLVGIGFFSAIGLYSFDTKDTPTALDVYRGKTTLEITYRDNIPVDSVVVYKVK